MTVLILAGLCLSSLGVAPAPTGAMTEIPLPIPGATSYVVRVSRKAGAVWIGTSAADAALRYDPGPGRLAVYPLARPGAVIRHLVVDDQRDEVWLGYGASRARIPVRMARLRLAR